MDEQRSQWRSRAGFIMAAMGSAIGLGNIWRFPYVAYENGGGVFLIPYVIALFLVGIPLMMLEFGLGHKMRQAFPGALRQIDPRFTWIGWWAVTFVMFGIVVYYCVIIAYCLCFFVFSFYEAWGGVEGASAFFFGDFLGLMPHLAEEGAEHQIFDPETQWINLGGLQWTIVGALALVWLANWTISFGQIQRGIERANRVFIPLLALCLLILVVWSWGFDGAGAGRGWYLKGFDYDPAEGIEWSRIGDFSIWVAAFGHIFFTLSLGFGIMCAYSSYLPRKGVDIPGNAVVTATGNGMFEFIAGFAVFSTVGFIAAGQVGQIPEDLSGPGLVFVTYPVAISQLIAMAGPWGNIFGIIFFGALVMAGLSSSISILEAFGAALMDSFGLRRGPVVTTLCLVAFLMGLVFCTQSGLIVLDIVDHFISSYGLVSVAALEAMIVAWVFTSGRLRRHLDDNADLRFHNWLNLTMRLIITAALALLWYGLSQLTDQGLGVGLVRLLVLVGILMVWLQEHWLDFDYKFVIPILLIFLLDQALIDELSAPFYEDYPPDVLAWIGAGWVVLTLLIAGVITAFDLGRPAPTPHAVDNRYPETTE